MAFGESTISRTQVQLLHYWFKEDREDVNDNARPGRPSTLTTVENIEAVKKMILDNRRITIREVANDVGILLRMFWHETCGSEVCSKISKF